MEAGEGGKREVRRRREWLSETNAERWREGERERDKGEGVRTLGYEHCLCLWFKIFPCCRRGRVLLLVVDASSSRRALFRINVVSRPFGGER